MNRNEKNTIISDLKDGLSKASVILLADYRGITVGQLEQLRRKCRKEKVLVRVVKNTLARRSVLATANAAISEDLVGLTLLAWSMENPFAPAKILMEYAKENDKFKIRIGVLDGRKITGQDIKNLAEMPPPEQLKAMLLGALNAPMSSLLAVLNAPASEFLGVVKAREEKLAAS